MSDEQRFYEALGRFRALGIEESRALKPWPKYDSTHHDRIAALASELGCVSEALAYERENEQRASVIEQLEAAE